MDMNVAAAILSEIANRAEHPCTKCMSFLECRACEEKASYAQEFLDSALKTVQTDDLKLIVISFSKYYNELAKIAADKRGQSPL